MARHFTVTLTSGTNVGPYDIYYDQINSSNFATLYGTTNDADGLTLSQVQSGVVVTVPNSASTILLYNTNADFNTDCQTTTITYNIPGQVTPTPTATQVPTSTPTPTSTSVPPTPTPTSTPVPTHEPTPTPTPTSTPTPTPTSTAIPPTPTATVQNTGTCQFWQVDLREIDETRYGIAYTHPTSGATESRFNQLESSIDPTDENIVVFGVCSESQSAIYDFDNNQLVIPQVGITQLADGGVCTTDNECSWTFQPTPTPTSTSVSPTPTEVVCRTYDCYADGGENVMFEYTNCDGFTGSVMVPLGDSVEICAREGSVTMLPNEGTIIPGQLCSGDPTPTPTATTVILPTPTPTSTQGVTLTQVWSDSQPGGGNLSTCDCVGQSGVYNFSILGNKDINSDLTNSTIYDNSQGNGTFLGDDMWYCLTTTSGSSMSISVQVDNMGNIIDWSDCSGIPPTPTPTPTATDLPQGCNLYTISNTSGQGDVGFTWQTCGDGSPTGTTIGPDGYLQVCSLSEPQTPDANGDVTYDGPCTEDPTPTPTPTDTPSGTGIPPTPTSTLGFQPTPTPTASNLNTFYVTSNSLTLDYFCDNNVNVSTEVQSTASSTSSLLGTTLYDANGNPVIGHPARFMVVSSVTGRTDTIFSPWTYINVDTTGEVIDQGTYNCDGSGGGIPDSESINPTPTPESSD